MKRRIFIVGSLVFLLLFSFLALSALPSDVIVINNADSVRESAVSSSATLLNLLNNVANRMTTQYIDKLEYIGLVTPPPALNTHLSAVDSRVGMQYADRARHAALAVVPPALQTRLDSVADRVTFQYPDRNRRVALGYPLALIGDTTPPAIVATPGDSWNGTTAVITWTTDEFTTYVLRYGTSSGVYTQQVSSDVFRKDQWATLTGLSPTETYYYQITSTDLSGNQAISPEYVLEGTFYVHLPFVTR